MTPVSGYSAASGLAWPASSGQVSAAFDSPASAVCVVCVNFPAVLKIPGQRPMVNTVTTVRRLRLHNCPGDRSTASQPGCIYQASYLKIRSKPSEAEVITLTHVPDHELSFGRINQFR